MPGPPRPSPSRNPSYRPSSPSLTRQGGDEIKDVATQSGGHGVILAQQTKGAERIAVTGNRRRWPAVLGRPSKKKPMGTSSASAARYKVAAAMRLAPRSYFCTC